MSKKLRFPEIPVIARRAHFSLAKTFLQSCQGIWAKLWGLDKVWVTFSDINLLSIKFSN
ncbi:hypothetical protein EW14_1737 [Prochlorococcus sp. MIT 0604]|nr:hypothetical protein EW14_1737 [Prochlorococcus sp. MIT 0604]